MSLIDPHKLHPNPGNTIFDPLPEDVYAALKADIAARGLLNPILCTSDYTVIAGHHRLQAALELGLDQVPVDIQDVDAAEAEDRLIADNVLRRQLSLGEQSRLIRRLKERHQITQGARGDLADCDGVHKTSAIIAEVPELAQASERKIRMVDHANRLIPPLFELYNAKRLPLTAADALANLEPDDQQALLDVLGTEQVSTLKASDIQQARRESQAAGTSHTESEVQAILQRVQELQAQKSALEQRLAAVDEGEAVEPDADLLNRLEEAEQERDQLAEHIAALQAQPPSIVERIIEKAVPTPDPVLAERITELQQRVIAAQRQAEDADKRRLETQTHYKQRLAAADQQAGHLAEQLATAQKTLETIGQSAHIHDLAVKHGAALMVQLQTATQPLLQAWPTLAPLTIHCALADYAVSEIQAIADQLQTVVTALYQVLGQNLHPDPTIEVTTTAVPAREALSEG